MKLVCTEKQRKKGQTKHSTKLGIQRGINIDKQNNK